jgi:toxin ParE1/3/4
MTPVEFSAEVEADLEEIGAYIAKESPYGASRFVQELMFACDAIADVPLGYPLYPDDKRQGSAIRSTSAV